MKILADVYFNQTGVDGKQINTTTKFSHSIFSMLIQVNKFNFNKL
jgi:hypothetical protein